MNPAVEVALIAVALTALVQMVAVVVWLVRLEAKVTLTEKETAAMKVAMAQAAEALDRRFTGFQTEIEKIKTTMDRQAGAHAAMSETLGRMDERIIFMSDMLERHFSPAPRARSARPKT